ncbi:MAG: phosphoadenosine phosphosulfate reductase [Dehalococcoidia bacterium]|nr:phosphoadenosine phosphosulfate reductase [Dehalococcoidia bacterium]
MSQAVKTYTQEDLQAISERCEGKTPQEIFAWAIGEFYPDITLACSFGGISGMVLLDMAVKIQPDIKVFYLDTDFLFPETYETVDIVSGKYGIKPLAFKSKLTPEEQVDQYGPALWSRDPDLCCALRKVEPNERAMVGNRAWIAGLRRDQSEGRKETPIVEWDAKFGLVKVNPLANWTERQVWGYIFANGVPYNPLHDSNYPSIGCTYCTKAVAPGADPRSGRWAEFEKDECGIHEDIPTSPSPASA